MELATLKDAFDIVMKKQKLTISKTQEMIDIVLQKFETKIQLTDNATCPIDNNSPVATDHNSLFEELKTELKAISHAKELQASEKDLMIVINEYSKLLEKHFIPDISKAYRHTEFKSSTLNLIIATHFYRQGLFDLGDTFMNEALKDTSAKDATEAVYLRRSFLKLFKISEALKSGNLEPAVDWAVENRETGIEMKLGKIQFVEILNKGRMHASEALIFAKDHLQPLSFFYSSTEVRKCIVLLLWAGRLERSPYRSLEIISQEHTHLDRVSNELKQTFCSRMGQKFCPLEVVIEAGAECLLVALGFLFHSVFVCPVLRERGSDVNPPMLMPCGHVISHFAIQILSGLRRHPFKCPYCPSAVDANLCRQIYF